MKTGKTRKLRLAFILVFAILICVCGAYLALSKTRGSVAASAAVDSSLTQDENGNYILEDEDGSKDYFNITLSDTTLTLNGLTAAGFAALGGDSMVNISEPFIVKIPSDVTAIGDSAFSEGMMLMGVNIPNGVKSIGDNSFYRCAALRSLVLPAGLTTIGANAFRECSALTDVIIPDGVREINNYAFGVCTSLTSVNIPDSVIGLGEGAFWKTGLTSITIPNSIATMGGGVFQACENLASVEFQDGAIMTGSLTFIDCPSLTSVTIPGSVEIGDKVFQSCANLESVVLEDGVTATGTYAFSKCPSLSSVTLPKSVTVISDYSFCECPSLTSITLPDSVTTIKEGAFWDSGLTSITIPGSVSTIESSTFQVCANLTNVVLQDGVTSTGEKTFAQCPSLSSVTLPNSLTAINNSAFWKSGLTSITIPGSVTFIDFGAIAECANLERINLSEGLTTIGVQAFHSCPNLTSITIPNSVTSMGNAIFFGCTSLKSIVLPNKLTSISLYTFQNCTNLESVVIPNSVTSIAECVFYNCPALSTVYFDGTPEQLSAVSVNNKDNTPYINATKKYAQHADPAVLSNIHNVTMTYGDSFNLADAGADHALRSAAKLTYSGTDAANNTFTDQAFNGVSGLNAGEYTLTVSPKGGANYYWAAADGSPLDANPTFKLKINKKTISSLDWKNTTAVYSGNTVPLPYALYGNGKYIALATIDDQPDGVTTVGEYTATIKDLGVNYNVTCSKSTTFKVVPALATVTWDESASTGNVNADGYMQYAYTGGVVVPGLSVEFAGAENENQTYTVAMKKADGTTVDLSTATVLDAGVYTLTVTLNENYAVAADKASSLTYTYEITPQEEITVEWIYTAESLYDGKAHNPVAYYTDDYGRMVKLEVAIKKGGVTVESAIEEGEYTAEIVTEGLPFAISAESVTSVTFKITKQSVTVVWNPVNVTTYTGEAQFLTAAVNGVDESELVYTYTDESGNKVIPVNAGVYSVSLTTKAGKVLGRNTFTINKAQLSKPVATVSEFDSLDAAKEYLPLGYDANTMALTGAESDGKYVVTVSIKDAGNYEWTDGSAETVNFVFDITHSDLKAVEDGAINWLVIGIIVAIAVVALISLIALILAFKKRRSQDSGNAVVSSDNDGFYDPYVE